jgi:transcription initiation factor TFIIIB Brf1 subunit/transcription initiation factor TFIIB
MDSVDDLDAIWEIAQAQFDIMREESAPSVKIDSDCNHSVKYLDRATSDVVCSECGVVLGRDAGQSVEWSNYKDDSGNFSKNTQRADLTVSDNPYSKSSTICGMFKNNNSLAAKIHLQQCFSHKQRTFWQISQVFENICTKAGLKADVLATAKHMWYICMESGKLTRASVREGLIASCLYYSCVFNKVPTNRNDILKYFDCDTKTLTKGEKVFYTIIESSESYRYLTKESVNIEENDSFVKYCNKLGLEWKTAMLCNDIFNNNKVHLSAVTPKSATCGVLVYVIKKKLELKNPTKSELSAMLNVCTPTINKVVDILVKNN